MSQLPRRRFFRLPWQSAAQIKAEVDEELQFELDMRTADLMSKGMSESDARAHARSAFGDLEATRAYCTQSDLMAQRKSRRNEWLAEVVQDVTLAVRGMRRAPGFVIVVLATLALGIGANTAVFSVVRKVLLGRLPYAKPDHLVRFYSATDGNPNAHMMLSAAAVAELQASPVFASVAPFGNYGGMTFVGDQRTEMWGAVQVGPEFFQVLGVAPLIGRPIDARDVAVDATPAVVLSHALWQKTFGGDSTIAGRTIQLDGRAWTVVGVMPASFVPPDRNPEVFTALDLRKTLRNPLMARRATIFRAIGRIANNAKPSAVRTTLDAIHAQMRSRFPEPSEHAPIAAVAIRDDMIGNVQPVLLVVMSSALLVLLITSVNVAGLYLARATTQRRELAVRAALGAGRGRLIRQLITESITISLVGGAFGLMLAFWGRTVLVRMTTSLTRLSNDAPIDGSVIAFAFAISILSAVAFGLAPAFAGTRGGINAILSQSSRGAAGGRVGMRARNALVVAQLALAVVLVIAAGLLGRTLSTLEQSGVGFNTGPDLLTFSVSLPSSKYPDAQQQGAFFDAFSVRLRTLPNVRSVASVLIAPWNGYTAAGPDSLTVESSSAGSSASDLVSAVTVSDGYIATLGIPLRAGREFSATDRDGAPLVALVSESLARRHWPGRSPLGDHIRLGGSNAPLLEVIGVTGEVRERPAGDLRPTVYVPMRQRPKGFATMIVQTHGNSTSAVPAVRRALHEMDSELPLVGAQTIEDIFVSMLGAQRMPMFFVTAFALLALLLAALGVYGVMAHTVTSRQREFGIRTALGAPRMKVIALVLRQGMTLAALGIVTGLVLALATTRLLSGLLVGITAHDPITFACTAMILLAICCVACVIPVRRATSADPVQTLRAE